MKSFNNILIRNLVALLLFWMKLDLHMKLLPKSFTRPSKTIKGLASLNYHVVTLQFAIMLEMSLIKLNFSSTRTKIMLLQRTRHFFMLQNAPLYQVYFLLLPRNLQNNQSSLPLAHDLRLVYLEKSLPQLYFIICPTYERGD